MPPKQESVVTFKGDWKVDLKKIKLRPNTPFEFQQIASDYEFTYKLAGEAKMSPNQQKFFERMTVKKSELMKKSCIEEIQKVIKKTEPEVDKIRGTSISKKKKEGMCSVLAKIAADEIENLIKGTNEDFEPMIDKNLAQFVKGKHHKSKKIKQIVKHSVKVPVAIAAVPVGMALTSTGFMAPIGLLALKNAFLTIKEAALYTQRHRQGMEKLARRIEKNIKILTPRAELYASLTEKAEKGDAWAIEELKLEKKAYKKDELVGYAFEKFIGVHRKTVGNLEELIDKYRKKINKHKFEAVGLGRKIDKAEDEVKKVEKKIKNRTAEIKDYRIELKKLDVSEKEIDVAIARMTKSNEKAEKHIRDCLQNAKFLDKISDQTFDRLLELEETFEKWVERVQLFKSQRPKSVATWKKVIKGAAFVESLAEVGLGGTADGIGGVASGAETGVAVVGYLVDAADETHNQKDLIVKAAKKLSS